MLLFKDVPKPEVGPGQILVKVRCCSICGSDTEKYKHDPDPGPAKWAMDDSYRKAFGEPVYTTLGHQISGDVAETGAGVTSCKVGDRVGIAGLGGYAEYVVDLYAGMEDEPLFM